MTSAPVSSAALWSVAATSRLEVAGDRERDRDDIADGPGHGSIVGALAHAAAAAADVARGGEGRGCAPGARRSGGRSSPRRLHLFHGPMLAARRRVVGQGPGLCRVASSLLRPPTSLAAQAARAFLPHVWVLRGVPVFPAGAALCSRRLSEALAPLIQSSPAKTRPQAIL